MTKTWEHQITFSHNWRRRWPVFKVDRRAHLRRLWRKPDTLASDADYWTPIEPDWIDPTHVLSITEDPDTWRTHRARTCVIRLRGAIVPIEVLGSLDEVFWLMELHYVEPATGTVIRDECPVRYADVAGQG